MVTVKDVAQGAGIGAFLFVFAFVTLALTGITAFDGFLEGDGLFFTAAALWATGTGFARSNRLEDG